MTKFTEALQKLHTPSKKRILVTFNYVTMPLRLI